MHEITQENMRDNISGGISHYTNFKIGNKNINNKFEKCWMVLKTIKRNKH